MKKIKICSVILVALFVLVLSGCGAKKTLECTANSSGVDITFLVGFEGNTIKTMDFGYDMDLSAYNDTQVNAIAAEDLCPTVKSSMPDYKDAFSKCDQKLDGKHLLIDAAFDVDKLAKSYLDKISTPDNFKTEMEKSGYTCKIK